MMAAWALLLPLLAAATALAQNGTAAEQEARCKAGLGALRDFARNAARGDTALESAYTRAIVKELGSKTISLADFSSALPGFREVEVVVNPWDRSPAARRRLSEALEELARQCARPREFVARIVGEGTAVVKTGEYMSTVAIYRERAQVAGRPWLCTGVLVDRNAVLTAAHCVCDLELKPPSLAESTVFFGEDLTAKNQLASTFRAFRPIREARLYNPRFCEKWLPARDIAVITGDDFALLKLEPLPERPPDHIQHNVLDITYHKRDDLRCADLENRRCLQPARIATPYVMLSARTQVLTIVGFGRNDLNSAGWKLKNTVAVVSPICGFWNDVADYGCTPGLEAVLVGSGGNDTCGGDSGGPVFAEYGGPDKRVLVAITSRSHKKVTTDCGEGGIYSLLTPYIVGWMRNQGVIINEYPYPYQ